MPLPEGGPWPPKAHAGVYERLSTWSAWYSGDPDELSAIYQRVGQRITNRPQVRPTQMRGGIVGTLARWFWGQPITLGQKRTHLHIPLAGDIASTSADLLFSEPITLAAPTDSTEKATTNVALTKRLQGLLDDGMHAGLLEAAEVSAGLGGVYLRAVWDRETSPDGPWLSAVHADAAIPEWRYGRLSAVTVWRVLDQDGTKVVRHLERHETGVILHAVYEGSATELGRTVPLKDYTDTAGLADVVSEGNRIDTGIDQLTAAYVPNMRPNRLWRNDPSSVHLGRSDYAGVEPEMDALDEVWTSWLRDIRLGKGRLIVPDAYLQSRGPGRGAMFDPDREIYESLSMLPGTNDMQIEVAQFDIRVEEHAKTAFELTKQIIGSAGYSPQSFGLAGEVAVTATEVAAKERKSLITRNKKILYWRPAIADMSQVLLKLGATHFEWNVVPDRPDVEFPPTVEQDAHAQAQALALLEQAKAVSAQTKVEMLHPEWDDNKIAEEVARINGEAGITVTNPDTFTGLPAAKAQVEPAVAPEPPAVAPGTNVGA